MKRGQASVEYLLTYGWALLILVAMLAALYGIGVFNPSRYLPQECVFQPGIPCNYFRLIKPTTNQFEFTLQSMNGLGFNISLQNVSFTTTDMGFPGTNTYSGSTTCTRYNQEGVQQYPSSCTLRVKVDNGPESAVSNTKVGAGQNVTFIVRINRQDANPAIGTAQRMKMTVGYRNCGVLTNPSTCDTQGPEHVFSGRVTANVEPK